jgi:flagellar biogenesis protein FliO
MLCTIDAKDENKEVGTVLNLFHKEASIGTSAQLIQVFLLILFLIYFFVITVVPLIT